MDMEKKLLICSQIETTPDEKPITYHIIPGTGQEEVMNGEVRNYFYPNIKDSEENVGEVEASLQGHGIKGKVTSVKNMF